MLLGLWATAADIVFPPARRPNVPVAITPQQYRDITIGMTVEEISRIIGSPPTEETTLGGKSFAIWHWETKALQVRLSNDRMTTISAMFTEY